MYVRLLEKGVRVLLCLNILRMENIDLNSFDISVDDPSKYSYLTLTCEPSASARLGEKVGLSD